MRFELSGVKKAFDGHVVLDGLDVVLEKVSCLAIIGPSGGGKSTLLRILAGLDRPDEGEVIVNGERMQFRKDWLHGYRKKNGVVFQAANLFPHLSAHRNLTLPLEVVFGYSKAQAEEVANQVLERFRLGAHAHKLPGQLSGGQKQRIAIARAVAHQPELVFLDEPTSALDPEMTAEVLDLVMELRRDGKRLILVTHEIGFAKQAADYLLLLADGKIVEHGVPDSVLKNPQSEAGKTFLARLLKY